MINVFATSSSRQKHHTVVGIRYLYNAFQLTIRHSGHLYQVAADMSGEKKKKKRSKTKANKPKKSKNKIIKKLDKTNKCFAAPASETLNRSIRSHTVKHADSATNTQASIHTLKTERTSTNRRHQREFTHRRSKNKSSQRYLD